MSANRFGPEWWIVAALTLAVCAGFLSPLIRMAITGEKLSEQGSDIVGNLLQSGLAIISMYVGAAIQKRRDDENG